MTTAPEGGARRLGVVVVDDDRAVAALHELFVRSHPSFEVLGVAHDGPSAVALIRRLAPDVVLLDFHLPGLSGPEVLRTVRASDARQPEFIAVTAARDVDSVRGARVAGVRHYLVKPFTAGALRDRLDEVAADRLRFASGPAPLPLDQDAIDDLLASGTRPAPLPKGLSPETLAAVERALEAGDPVSSTEAGALAGISRVSARRYLEYLVGAGRAERTLDYRTAGRPSSRYRRISRAAP
jgi:response regulator of citrate/malate metabolism